ncbi:MAG: hypothetical protein U1F61_30205 [Opitutaceae bacterium]
MTAPAALSAGPDRILEHRHAGQSAEAGLWWRDVPTLPGEKLGVIGAFSASGPEAAAAVLEQAASELAGQGCTLAVGPMDGNTWRRYRLVTDPGTDPAFFLEPTNPPEWPQWWQAAGYTTLATYTSTVADDLQRQDPRVAAVAERLRAGGMVIRPLSLAAFRDELTRIYDVSIESFQENYLYTPLPAEAFLGQYLPLQSRVVPELVLLAEKESHPMGYVFAVPDLAQAARGERVDTFIVKTLAVRPGRACAGLGAWLLAEVHQAARALGYRRAIHALMHESNRSRNLSAHYARTIRRYALFSKSLR